jgi:hypothetical protein
MDKYAEVNPSAAADESQLAEIQAASKINVYRVGTLKNRPLDEASRPKVNKLESEI